MAHRHQIILCTCPDQATAQRVAETLVTAKLAACVNIVPGLTSVYRWQGRIESAQEHLLLIKTRQDRYPALEASIRQNHPYELPEIIAVSVEQGLPEYLHWIDKCLVSK
ncbi:MAG: divalent-cation tolerance protein CutA [Gammaproteobacteria bacterium HGW-Gammaproteobacteria-3]|nr:MAG: divalent-cation tolerance protein CutA [Gammaproteobacteria bacterium HGW-Gammaproteobacteria-3]